MPVYRASSLRELLDVMGFEVMKVVEFNRLGAPGWAYKRLTRRKAIVRWQVWFRLLLLPLAKRAERSRFLPGPSWIVVAEKVDEGRARP